MRDFTKFICEYFKDKEDLLGAEIGVFRGDNAYEIFNHAKPALLVLVDCWHPVGLGHFDGDDKGESERNFLATYKLHVNHKGVVIVKGWSGEAVQLFRGFKFDFIYVDGNHCQLNCKEDLTNWFPLVEDGGVFGGHDYNMDGVKQAVSEVFPGQSITIGKGEAGVDWWFIKEGTSRCIDII